MALALKYLGHEPGASLGYFTGAFVTLKVGEVFPLPRDGLVLGRRASADLRVASSQVAPHHCKIAPTGPETALVVDLRSTNGTKIGDERVTERVLRVGEVVTLADGLHFELTVLD